jgi:hypothetical protein
MRAVGDALAGALVRPGHVVAPVNQPRRCAGAPRRDQHAVEEFSAQGADQSFADRVLPRSLDGRTHDPRADGLEDGIERASEVRSAIADQEPDVLEPLAEAESEVAGLLRCPVSGWVRGDAAQMHPAGTVLDEHQHVYAFQQHGVHVQEIDREDPGGLGCQELPPRRAGPARRRIDTQTAPLPSCSGDAARNRISHMAATPGDESKSSAEKLVKHGGRSGGYRLVRVELHAYPQSGVSRIHPDDVSQ